MALAPFFDRVYGAVGGHLAVSRESLVDSLGSTAVGIDCGSHLKANDRFIAEMCSNLMARLYPRLALSGPLSDTEALKSIAVRINPDIEIIEQAPPERTICVGSGQVNGTLFPSASGWLARLGHQGSVQSGAENPYSSAAAAAFACAELFRRIFVRTAAEPDLSLSLIDYGSNTGENLELLPQSIGRVLFVGVGAIGNAAIWALARDSKASGSLALVDPEPLSLSNLQRYVLGSFSDISRSKTSIARESFGESEFNITAIQSSIEQFTPPEGWSQPPTTCVSVDNILGRRSAQALLPKLIINGWTGEQSLGVSWHEFSREMACLACLYQPHGQGLSATQQAARALGLPEERAAMLWVTRAPLSNDELLTAANALGVEPSLLDQWKEKALPDLYTDVVCGAVPINIQPAGRLEVVPLAHQSVLAGALMAAELLKRTQEPLQSISQQEPLVAWENVLKSPPKNWRRPRPRERGCFCNDPIYQAVYHKKWNHSNESIKPV